MRVNRLVASTFLIATGIYSANCQAQTEKPIYSFAGTPDGSNPGASVVVDGKTGNIYGVTTNGGSQSRGAVFQLVPPATAGGTWQETVIYSFGLDPDGLNPNAIVEDQQTGILYGTTMFGGTNANGILFKLTPPSASGTTWSESVVYNFGPLASAGPLGDLIMDASGNLYATTIGGAVFELTPPSGGSGGWSASMISPFQNIFCDLNWPNVPGLVFDAGTGTLFGSAPCGGILVSQVGAVFQLTPPASSGSIWTQSNQHYFQGGAQDGLVPSGSLVDLNGIVYGTTQGGGTQDLGTVYELIPPIAVGGSSLFQLLHTFSGGSDGQFPLGGLVAVNGVLFGTTSDVLGSGSGTIFGLYVGANGAWTEVDLYAFNGSPGDGANPYASLTAAPNGVSNGQATLYGTTYLGGATNNGTVFVATLPVSGTGSPGSLFRAICETICFENSLRWRRPPPPWILGSNSIAFDSTVQSVREGGKVVEFMTRSLIGQSKFPVASMRTLTITFSRPTDFKPGQQCRLIAKGPVVGLSPRLELLGFWKVQPR